MSEPVESLRALLKDLFNRLEGEADSSLKSEHEDMSASTVKQMMSVLNKLEKSGLINDLNLHSSMTDGRDLLLKEYDAYLRQQGNSDRKTPKSRLNRLIEFYQAKHVLDIDGLSFSKALILAAERKYGPIVKGVGRSIGKVTLHTISRDIIDDGIKEGFDFPNTRGGANALVRWFKGENLPISDTSKKRITYIEKFFDLPNDSLLSLLPNTATWGKGKRASNPPSANDDRDEILKNVLSELPPGLQGYYDEYSKYRLKGKPPKITVIADDIKNDRKAIRRLDVKDDIQKGVEWSINANGECQTQVSFRNNLLTYCTFLINEEGVDIEDITTAHLTDSELLEEWVSYQSERKIGGSIAQRLLVQIGTSSRTKNGYFRHCGDMGDRSYENYQDDLDLINEKISDWWDRLEKSVSKIDGKANVQFLLDMDSYDDVWSSINDVTKHLFKQAGILTHGKKKRVLSGNDLLESDAKSAYLKATSAVLLQLNMVQPLRKQNLLDLRYFTSDNASNSNVPSITWMRSEGRYRLSVPKAFLKNRSGKKTNDIKCLLPNYLTPIINEFLKYREIYIGRCIRTLVPDAEPDRFLPSIGSGEKGIKKSIKLNFVMYGTNLGANFRRITWIAFLEVRPDLKQQGINIHATRHLAATIFLNENSGNFPALAVLLNDTLEVVLKTYSEINYSKQINFIVDWAQNKQRNFSL